MVCACRSVVKTHPVQKLVPDSVTYAALGFYMYVIGSGLISQHPKIKSQG